MIRSKKIAPPFRALALFWRPKNPQSKKVPVKHRALARGRVLSADFYDSTVEKDRKSEMLANETFSRAIINTNHIYSLKKPYKILMRKNLTTILAALTGAALVGGCVPYNAIRKEAKVKGGLPCTIVIYQNPNKSAPSSEKLAAEFTCHNADLFITGRAYLDSDGNASRYELTGGAISATLKGNCAQKSEDDKAQEICGILSEMKSQLKK
ncbi:hypothetical protein HY772_02795 [Candidatus Woesearchaeota archaeon]|nr:hypothetical protein [Candidatus Woesearchaeota archaeon]